MRKCGDEAMRMLEVIPPTVAGVSLKNQDGVGRENKNPARVGTRRKDGETYGSVEGEEAEEGSWRLVPKAILNAKGSVGGLFDTA